MLGGMSEENESATSTSETTEATATAGPETTAATTGPANHFEMMIRAAQHDPALNGQVIATFMNSEVFFLSREKVTGESHNAQPMLLQNAQGRPVIALFTDLGRIPGAYIDVAPYGVQVLGGTVIRSLQDTGLVINPGDELCFEIDDAGVRTIREEFNLDGTPKNPTK
ncbi:hypothetical protein CGQ24_05260 [Arthrobacter sp. 7749]|nr:hypothetical protein CGQ24_05260 [Arthrobacter sp. 7749]